MILIAGCLALLLIGNAIVLRIALGKKPEDLGRLDEGWIRRQRREH